MCLICEPNDLRPFYFSLLIMKQAFSAFGVKPSWATHKAGNLSLLYEVINGR